MISLVDMSVENYRSIVGKPFDFTFDQFNVIVGPNNCGKSNILRALQLFFNGYLDGKRYDAALDFPRGVTAGARSQTRITVTVRFDPETDRQIEKTLNELEKESGQNRLAGNLLRLRLQYTRANNEQWRFISRAGVRSVRADLIEPVVAALRAAVRFKYLPVGRDIQETIRTELSDDLIRTIFSGWSGAIKARREINGAIETLVKKLEPRLISSGGEITKAIADVFLEIKKLELRLPFNSLETLLPSLVPSLSDSHETGLREKGAGIQTSTLLFLLKYLADHHPQRHNLRVTYIWALEEPESYLHPSRQRAMSRVLQKFAKDVQTIITTHSPHFVPRDPTMHIAIIDKASVVPHGTIIVGQSFEIARQLLGVSLLDSMYLYPINIVVEGPSDEILFRGAWSRLYKEGRVRIDPATIRFFPGNNASGACTLFESLVTYGDGDEVDICLILDNDSAGQKALNGLLERTRSQVSLKSNHDYFMLPRDTEWLVSGSVMKALARERPTQVSLVVDTNDDITKFSAVETNKKIVAQRVLDLSTVDDLNDFAKVIARIEKRLHQ